LLQPRDEKEKRKLQEKQEGQERLYNRKTKDLQPLEEGDVVRLKPFKLGQREWKKAVVTKRVDERSYDVEEQEGEGVYRRNRCHLRKTKEVKEPVSNPPTPDARATTAPEQQQAVQEDQTQPQPRPQRKRRQPSYLKDYVTTNR